MVMSRVGKKEYWIGKARSASVRSPCSRRKFGAIIVKDGIEVGAGYNGSARGCLNCGIDVPCIKEIANEPSNLSYEYCPAVHAEQNAIINSNRDERIGATMYLAPSLGQGDRPCYKCRRHILNARIKDIYYVDKDGEIQYELISEEGVDDFIKIENDWIHNKLNEANPDWELRLL